MNFRSILSFGIVAGLVISIAGSALAQEKMFIMPYKSDSSWFIYEVDPGDSFKDIMAITNNSDHEQTVQIVPVDAEATVSGAFALKPASSEQKNVGSWLSVVGDDAITMGAGERKYFQFMVNVPDDVPPGDYAGGLVLIPYEVDNGESSSGTGIKTVISVGVRVYMTVSGEVDFNFLWDEYQKSKNANGDYVFNYKFTNDGNVAVEANGSLRLESAFFDSMEIPLTTGVVYAGESIKPIMAWKNPFPFGPVKATTVVDYSRSNVVGALSDASLEEWSGSYTEDLSFWIIPYWEFLLAIMVFVGTFGFTYFRSHRLEKFRSHCSQYVSPIDENLTVIAARAGVSWKMLAKINKLKFPYMVARGQAILAPLSAAAPTAVSTQQQPTVQQTVPTDIPLVSNPIISNNQNLNGPLNQ